MQRFSRLSIVPQRRKRSAVQFAESKVPRGIAVQAARALVPAPPIYGRRRGGYGNQEIKFFDCPVTQPAAGLPLVTAPPTGAEPAAAFVGITEVNCVPQGATAYNRIGTKIQIKSVQFGAVFQIAGDSASHNTVRYMLIYDQQPNGAFPALLDILSTNVSTVPGFFSGVNMSNRSRFTVLRDRLVDLDKDTRNQVSVKEFIRCNLESQFRTNTATIGDLTTGAIYLVAFCFDKSAVNYVTMQSATTRIRYAD